MDVLGEGVLKFIACCVTIDGDVPDDSPIEVLLLHTCILHPTDLVEEQHIVN